MRKAPLLLAALALAIACWWLLQRDDHAPSLLPLPRAPVAEPGDQAASATGTAATVDERDLTTSANANPSERRAVADGRAALQVHAVWADQSPAPGVLLYLLTDDPDGADVDCGAVLTDDQGNAAFPDLQPGPHQLRSDREDRQTVAVVAGAQQVTFTLAAGVHVLGTVRDASGRPVADAGIWLQTARTRWDAGREVARSDANGAFELAHMNAALLTFLWVPPERSRVA